MVLTNRPSQFPRVALFALAALALPACSAWDITELFVDPDTEASFTLKGDALDPAALESELLDRFGVKAAVDILDTGATVIELIGVYEQVVDATKWMLVKGLELLANEEVAEMVLTAAVSLMK